MIGVTLFGVLVTPVFFYLIDTASESSMFRSTWVRRIGSVVLGIVTLSYLWRPSRWRVQPRAGAASPEKPRDLDIPGH
jgi:multidrug efflux pump